MNQTQKTTISQARETMFDLVRIVDFLVEAVDLSIATEEPVNLGDLHAALVEHRKNLLSIMETFNPTHEAPPEHSSTNDE